MVTDAVWVDLNKDGFMDLVAGGEWMSLRAFINKNGQLTDATPQYFGDTLKGWWSRLRAADMDGDGDMDLVAGNWGLNSPVKVSAAEPATMYYSDFDNNGSVDPLICTYIQGKSYPMASRDEMTDQMVSLRKKFPNYSAYSNACIEDILTEEQLKSAKQLSANYLETSYLENDNGKFTLKKLPPEANFFPVYAIATGDFNKDGNQDILLGGNTDHARIKIGKIDAGYGTLLTGDGKGNFTYVNQLTSGLSVKGCIRDIVDVKGKDGSNIIFAVNDQPVSIYTY